MFCLAFQYAMVDMLMKNRDIQEIQYNCLDAFQPAKPTTAATTTVTTITKLITIVGTASKKCI